MFLHKKVVVIDDDKKVLMLMENLLNKMGCRTFKALRGKPGLELVKKEKPHLLICDMFIPDMQGSEIVEQVRSLHGQESIKIILISGVYKDFSIEPKIKKMSDAIIAKPIDIKKLAEKIIALLS